jgi:hypothetical protein
MAVIAVAFLSQSWSLGWGSVTNLGPGVWPSVLATVLSSIGIAMALARSEIQDLALRTWPVVFVIGGMIIYMLAITKIGLLFTALLASIIVSMARIDSITPRTVFSSVTVLLAVVVFLKLIGIDTPLWPTL